jgi:hypothetical protein
VVSLEVQVKSNGLQVGFRHFRKVIREVPQLSFQDQLEFVPVQPQSLQLQVEFIQLQVKFAQLHVESLEVQVLSRGVHLEFAGVHVEFTDPCKISVNFKC